MLRFSILLYKLEFLHLTHVGNGKSIYKSDPARLSLWS